MTPRRTDGDREAVEAAHRAYYDAWERGDVAGVAAAWLDSDECCCVFPGHEPIHGAEAIRRHMAELMSLTEGIQFLFEDVRVVLLGDVAFLGCVEVAVTPRSLELGDVAPLPDELAHLTTARLAVTSTFVRTPGGWRMFRHTAGPILTHLDDEDPR